MKTMAIVVIAIGTFLAFAALVVSSWGATPGEKADVKDWNKDTGEQKEAESAPPKATSPAPAHAEAPTSP